VIDLRVAITHYPVGDRPGWLQEQLGLLERRPNVCVDTVGYRLENYRCAWDVALRGGTHLAVLSDDMLPCPNFEAQLAAALRVRPRSVICLFTMRQILEDARELGYSWIETDNCAWGGAMVMPCDLWTEMATWERWNVIDDAEHQSDDTRIALWVRATKRRIYLTAPSLVQHVGAGASTVGHSNVRRVSSWVADMEPIDWDTPSLRGGSCARGDTAWLRERSDVRG
jgi:hypothetical protein